MQELWSGGHVYLGGSMSKLASLGVLLGVIVIVHDVICMET